MPKFLEKKLKARYGKDSAVPYKIMNAMGAMHGNKETAKGRQMEKKHKKHKSNPNRYQPTGLIRGLGGERKRAAEKSKGKGPSFTEAMNRS